MSTTHTPSLPLVTSTIPKQAIVKPTIFREYINASKKCPDDIHKFPDIIHQDIDEFHFIIAFVQEEFDEQGRGRGKFYRNWKIKDFDGETIHKLKNNWGKKVKVKVFISIGGYAFNPAEKDFWVDEAVRSLGKIINEDLVDDCGYKMVDGIDINYDTINDDEFPTYMGDLIKKLKYNNTVKMFTIAPSKSVLTHYTNLYSKNKHYIAWVDYQFYAEKISSQAAYEELYRKLASDYFADADNNTNKLLAGFSTDPIHSGNINQDDFFGACKHLIDNCALPGIFFWDANDSALLPEPFKLEKKAQQLLVQGQCN